ncbi:SDR family NAD(P)-dependent oxidoreductase [Paenibacillus artemisiicola]
MMDLNEKVAIVTGGASGIGLATVRAFIEKGAKVVLADLNEPSGMEIEKKRFERGAEAYFVPVNVADEKSVEHMVTETIKKYGRLDIMINNAGIGAQGAAHELSYSDYQNVIAVNQDGVFFGAKYAIREMLKTGGGVIVNTASVLGLVGQPGAFAYNASKGAVNSLTKSLALEYAKHNIRVNSVCPGYVESGMVNRDTLGDYYTGLVARHPIGRLGHPSEIAHAVVFLCENEFVTGCNLVIDGGYTAH